MIRRPEPLRCQAIDLCVVDGRVVLACEPDDPEVPLMVAVLSVHEAHGLRSRIHKAANDAGADAARSRRSSA